MGGESCAGRAFRQRSQITSVTFVSCDTPLTIMRRVERSPYRLGVGTTGVIFAAIALAWLAYLVPHFVRRRDDDEELDGSDPADRFSDSMRIVRHGTAPLLDHDLEEIAVMDLDDDGWEDDIVGGDSGSESGSAPGWIFAFDNNSAQLWNITLPDSSGEDNIFSLVVEDINDDGIEEIAFSSEEFERIYVINKTGSGLWEYTIGHGDIGTLSGDKIFPVRKIFSRLSKCVHIRM